jgi:DnaJ-class molecular chaperone
MTTDIKMLEGLRTEYRKLRRNALTWMTRADFDAQIQAHIPAKYAAPTDYIAAAEQVTCKCDRCQGTGEYRWGGTINGKPVHTGTCFCCEGKGRMDQDDFRRNWAYIRWAIVQACR